MSPSTKTLHHALRYAARGWFVLPLNPRTKQPVGRLVPRGALDAKRDERTLEKWFEGKDFNVAIATGKNSGIWVLDIDGPVGGLVWWQWEAAYGHCFTLSQRTGRRDGGRQLFFRYPSDLTIKSRTNVLTGLDTRGDSGYVVAPPSVHPSGKMYKWEGKVPLNEAPMKLLELIGAQRKTKPTSAARDTRDTRDTRNTRNTRNTETRSRNYGPRVCDELLRELSSCARGGRDQLAFRVATRLLELERDGDIERGMAEKLVWKGLAGCGYLDDQRKERGEKGFYRIMNSARKRLG